MNAPTQFKYVGTRPIRHDGVDKVTGRANYGADYTLPGMLHAAILRSPHAHAKILSIDTSRAEQVPGVMAVLTAADIPETDRKIPIGGEGFFDMHDWSDNLMARRKVLYNGHAVAAVAATTYDIAREACKLIEVKYEKLPAVMSIEAAIAPGAPILHENMTTQGQPAPDAGKGPTNVASRMELMRGDVAKGFAEADIVVERTFRTRMAHQGYIEPHACVVRWGQDGQIFIWSSSQGHFMVRDATAGVLGLDASKVKAVPAEIGGGFGGKTIIYLEPVAAALSRKSNRPVKLVMSREEVLRATGPTSGTLIKMKIGAKKDGTLVAAESSMWYEGGAYRGAPAAPGAMCCWAPYRIPNFRVEAMDVVLNMTRVAAYRAPGSPNSAYATESLLDEIAQKLNVDPIDLRLKNAVQEGDVAPYGVPFGPIGLRQCLEAAKKHPHWNAPLPPHTGRGIAAGFWFNAGMNSSASVMFNNDGSASVITGNPDIGGTRAAQALMVAEELGVPVERVRPMVADTDSTGFCDVTGGSRVCYATGMAVINAARDVRDQLRERAAKIWDVDVSSVGWENGCAVPLEGAGNRQPLTLVELGEQLSHTGGPIVGRASLNPPMAGPGFAVHICDIEVDPETGRSVVKRYTTIQDAGKAVHPSYVEGQMQGGASQGIGWALNEEYIYSQDGVMENASFLDYRMPVCSDLPMIDTVIIEVPNPLHPYGVRGVGEVPIVPPLATVNNAVSRAAGVRFNELPLSPPRVLAGMSSAQG
ncbi:MAG: xanthine dehydrogenase family protein molybdopterin-binding subunit [Gammaproteobacteria bacterium]